MSDLHYKYQGVSTIEIKKTKGINNLVWHIKQRRSKQYSLLFLGSLTEPYITAKCWVTIAKVVRSSFGPIP
jgi:hypothetical protein